MLRDLKKLLLERESFSLQGAIFKVFDADEQGCAPAHKLLLIFRLFEKLKWGCGDKQWSN